MPAIASQPQPQPLQPLQLLQPPLPPVRPGLSLILLQPPLRPLLPLRPTTRPYPHPYLLLLEAAVAGPAVAVWGTAGLEGQVEIRIQVRQQVGLGPVDRDADPDG